MQDLGQVILSWAQQPGFIAAFIGCGVAVGLVLSTGRATPVPVGKKKRRR